MTEPIVTEEYNCVEAESESVLDDWNAFNDVFQRPEVLEVNNQDILRVIEFLSSAVEAIIKEDIDEADYAMEGARIYYECLTWRQKEHIHYKDIDNLTKAVKFINAKMEKRFLKRIIEYFNDPEREKEAQKIKDEHSQKSVVYFLADKSQKAVKIGTSTDLHKRIETIQACNPYPLVLLNSIPGDYKTEWLWHERFKSLRISHEWFKLEPVLLRAIKAGSF